MTPEDLLGRYRTALNHINLTYASLVLWSYPDTQEYFETLYAHYEDIPKPFDELPTMLRSQQAMRIACEEMYESAHRSAVTNLFPLTRAYLRSINQLDNAKGLAWFRLFYVLRNYFAHDMTFHFNEYERTLLPLVWSGVTINASMNGQRLTHGQLSRGKLREMLKSAQTFVTESAA